MAKTIKITDENLDDIEKTFENLLEKLSKMEKDIPFELNCKVNAAFNSLVGSTTINYSYFKRIVRPALHGINTMSD